MSSSRSIRRGAPGELLKRMIRAARLDASLYKEVTADVTATGQALAVVALVALAHGTAGMVRALSFGWADPVVGSLFGVVGEIAFFSVASLVIYLLGRFVFGQGHLRAGTAPVRFLRCAGFAHRDRGPRLAAGGGPRPSTRVNRAHRLEASGGLRRRMAGPGFGSLEEHRHPPSRCALRHVGRRKGDKGSVRRHHLTGVSG